MKPSPLCLIFSLFLTLSAFAAENTNHTLITGSFGTAWLDGEGIIRLLRDDAPLTTPVPGVKVFALLAADLLEEGSDQLIYLDDARKSLHIHSFKTGTTLGPFGSNVRTMAVGRCSADETFPSLFVSTFSGDAFRWTKEIMGGAWHPVPGTFTHASRGRFDPRNDLDDFAVVADGNVYIYSTKWNTYSKAVEGKNITAVLTGNLTTTPGDEIAMFDNGRNVLLYQGKTLEDLGQQATCLAVGRNADGLDTLYALDQEGGIGRYNREAKKWEKVVAGITLGGTNLIVERGWGVFVLDQDGKPWNIPMDNMIAHVNVYVPRGITILMKDKKQLARYRYGGVPFKPYIDELRTPSGKNILRDAPWDHLHHHALMYAIRVDGHNFWEENDPRAGKQFTTQAKSTGESEIDWNIPDSKTLLKETRKISVNREDDVTLLDWKGSLTAVNDAELGGGHYHGLGMRFVEEMDTGGRFFSDSDKNEKEIVRGDEALTRCRWMAYTAKLDGTPVTVAIFDHPSNPIPMTAFTMGDASDAFAYLSATMNLHREPVKLKAGETFTILYRVAVWDGEVSPETVEAQYREFVR